MNFTPFKSKTLIFLTIISFFFLSTLLHAEPIVQRTIKKIYILTVDASINPGTYNYLSTAFTKAQKEVDTLIVIKLNTPGGLLTTTKQILSLIGESHNPVAIWITPEGASATSAGAIIASSAHFLFMSEGTNIGAATPVQLGKPIEKGDLKDKAINDLVALTGSLAEARGRNSKLFGNMISQASSYKSKEALDNKLIDGIINDLTQLMSKIDGTTTKIRGFNFKLKIDPNKVVIPIEMDLGQMLLNIFANPMTAYILFILGAALLYFEFQAPGGYIAGSLGAILLVLAAIGFQILPVNFGALGLIILAFILFILEAYITSYGILSITGMIALLFGSMFLFRSEDGYLGFEPAVIYSTIAAIAIFLATIGFYMAKTHSRRKEEFFSKVDRKGVIVGILENQPHASSEFVYQIKVAGVIWKATSSEKLSIGDQVIVKGQNDTQLMLEIISRIN